MDGRCEKLRFEIKNKDTGEILADNATLARSGFDKFFGLMFKFGLNDGEGMIFPTKKMKKLEIHTFFVFFSIDLIFLNDVFKVVEIKRDFSPFQTYKTDVHVRYLIELPSGKAKDVRFGDEIDFSPSIHESTKDTVPNSG